jgi:hypothetical protein
MTSDYLDIDLRDERPRFTRPRRHLTAEDREVLGPLARAQTLSDDPADVLDGLYERARDDLYGGDLKRAAMAMGALRRACEILVNVEADLDRACQSSPEKPCAALSVNDLARRGRRGLPGAHGADFARFSGEPAAGIR